eukprot:14308016-Alexandrium_andersonii.AAC.1
MPIWALERKYPRIVQIKGSRHENWSPLKHGAPLQDSRTVMQSSPSGASGNLVEAGSGPRS